jgi:hypothetical protein
MAKPTSVNPEIEQTRYFISFRETPERMFLMLPDTGDEIVIHPNVWSSTAAAQDVNGVAVLYLAHNRSCT